VLQQSPEWEVVGIAEPFAECRANAEAGPAFEHVRWLSQDDLLRVRACK
jgi:hypothetical protein